jgi:galactose mutarotase-like enzyme
MAGAQLHTWRGEVAVTLTAGATSATFLPSCGMVCASLRHRGDEYVAWPRTLAQFRAGRMTAVPLVHPWGNRLSHWEYRAAARRVDLRGLDLPADPNGLPIHGNLRGAPFAVTALTSRRIRAEFDYGADAERMRAFPFPHVVAVDAQVNDGRVRVDTRVTPTSDRAVPISFCWHPYVRLPAARRRDWVLRWPACEHVEVDGRIIPTGERTPLRAEHAPLGTRTFDDHYALGSDRRFSLSAAGRRLTLRFGATYPFAQLFVPPKGEFVAIEPMTARIDALTGNDAPICAPGSSFDATFSMSVDTS